LDASTIDGPVVVEPEVSDVAHLPQASWYAGAEDMTLGSGLIDTDALTITGTTLGLVPDFVAEIQPGGGPRLAVLRVASLEVSTGAEVRVVGSRPFVIVSAGDVTVSGTIDAGGRRAQPGAGGSASQDGLGKGADGSFAAPYDDSGGGGASFGTVGREGGQATVDNTVDGGLAGATYGDSSLSILQGGSGGGLGGSDCSVGAGAGGGAVQIYSATKVMVVDTGVISVGGGGGSGAAYCDSISGWGGGAGGGSGGAIYLQAPIVATAGNLAANGGGGGGGGGSSTDGGPGGDGWIGTVAAAGGADGGDYATDGGAGATRTVAAEPGVSGNWNVGGGGGGLGRIVVSTKQGFQDTGEESPAVVEISF
jgi:hypothetical protein